MVSEFHPNKKWKTVLDQWGKELKKGKTSVGVEVGPPVGQGLRSSAGVDGEDDPVSTSSGGVEGLRGQKVETRYTPTEVMPVKTLQFRKGLRNINLMYS